MLFKYKYLANIHLWVFSSLLESASTAFSKLSNSSSIVSFRLATSWSVSDLSEPADCPSLIGTKSEVTVFCVESSKGMVDVVVSLTLSDWSANDEADDSSVICASEVIC